MRTNTNKHRNISLPGQATGSPEGEIISNVDQDEMPPIENSGETNRDTTGDFTGASRIDEHFRLAHVEEICKSLPLGYFTNPSDSQTGKEPMVRGDLLYALFHRNQDRESWNSEMVSASKSLSGASDKFSIEFREEGEMFLSLGLALSETLVGQLHRGLPPRLLFIEAIDGKHTEESLEEALDLCIRMLPNEHGQVDLLPLHEYLEVQEPFSTWRARVIKESSMAFGLDFRSPRNDHQVSEIMAQQLAMGTCTRRGLKIRKFYLLCHELMEPDPDKRWQTMVEAFGNEPGSIHPGPDMH